MPKAKTGQNTTKSLFPTVSDRWGSNRKKILLEKVAEKTIPDSVVTFLFDFGTPFALGAEKGPAGPCGASCCCCLFNTGSTFYEAPTPPLGPTCPAGVRFCLAAIRNPRAFNLRATVYPVGLTSRALTTRDFADLPGG